MQFTPKAQSRHPTFPSNATIYPGAIHHNLNPGNIASLHKRVRDIIPVWFEGVQAQYKKRYDINRVLMMSWGLGNNTPLGFHVGGEYSRKINSTSMVIIDS